MVYSFQNLAHFLLRVLRMCKKKSHRRSKSFLDKNSCPVCNLNMPFSCFRYAVCYSDLLVTSESFVSKDCSNPSLFVRGKKKHLVIAMVRINSRKYEHMFS